MKHARKKYRFVLLCGALVLFVLLAAVLTPRIYQAFMLWRLNNCDNILRQIESAKEQYALEHGLAIDSAVPITPEQLSYLLKGGWTGTRCPSGGKYTINPLGVEPECTFHGNRHKIEQESRE